MRAALGLLVICACGSGSASSTDAATGNDGARADAAVPTRLVAYVSGGADITWYDIDKTTGALGKISSIAAFNPGANFLAFSGNRVYAVTSGDRVGAYSLDPATAGLTFINDVSSGGQGPAHVAVDHTGKFVLVANYSSGHIAAMPVQTNGGLATAPQQILAGMNAHQIMTDPSNKFVLVPCLGDDKVAQYTFNDFTGGMGANSVPQYDTANGAGPRHLAFAPGAKHVYLINELDSTLSALAFDSATGRLTHIETASSRANGANGTNTTAEVLVHPSGKFVYGSNRGDNNIAVFSRDETTGMIDRIEHVSTQGMTPRNFTIDPTGTLLYVANQNSGTVVPFKIDTTTGRLTPTAAAVSVPTPMFVGIVALPE